MDSPKSSHLMDQELSFYEEVRKVILLFFCFLVYLRIYLNLQTDRHGQLP